MEVGIVLNEALRRVISVWYS